MKKIVFVALMAILTSGAIFNSCQKGKEEELTISKIEKNDVVLAEDQSQEMTGEEFCTMIHIHWRLFPDDFIVSYLDEDGIEKTHSVSPDTELGKQFYNIFLHKVKYFSGTKDELCKWETAEKENGNIVVSYKDKETGIYKGASYTPAEYKEKFGRL